jgi:hypothetical protein
VIVGVGALMTRVAIGAIFSLAVFLEPMSAATAFGRDWNLPTFKRQVSPAEMERAMNEQFGPGMTQPKKVAQKLAGKK